ncbi:hypothetical protein SCA6_003896, partial [Theobroma cacao]
MKEKTLAASDGMVGHKAINADADKNSKHYSLESPTQPSSPLFGQMSIAAAEREMTGSRGLESTLDAAEGKPDVQLSPIKQGKQTKNNKTIKNNKNRVTGGRNMGLPTSVENDGTLRQKSTQEDTEENLKNISIKLPMRAATSQQGERHRSEHVGAVKDSKNYFSKSSTQGATFMHGESQLMTESEPRGQNYSMDMMEGKSANQTTDNNKFVPIVVSLRDIMEAYVENPPNLEFAS